MKEFFKSKKNIISVLTLLILILAIPLGMRLVRQQQTVRSRAAEGAAGVVTFSGPNVETRANKTVLRLQVSDEGVTEAKVDLILTSPLGPAGAAAAASGTPTASPSPAAASTGGGGGGASVTVEAASPTPGASP